jgi:hypothetical protein
LALLSVLITSALDQNKSFTKATVCYAKYNMTQTTTMLIWGKSVNERRSLTVNGKSAIPSYGL